MVWWAVMVWVDICLQNYFRWQGRGVMNRGVSFGAFTEWGYVMAICAYLGLVIFWIYLMIKKKKREINGLKIILLGGLGNLLPRILGAGVWDYLLIPGVPIWFNLSDLMISLGVLLYLFPNFFDQWKERTSILKENDDTDSIRG